MIRVIVILAAAVAARGVAIADEPQADREALLERHGLAIGAPIKQGFSAYIGPSLPVFVTSDSLLMAWHRVFEEMIAREEVARMAMDMKIWRELWNHVPQAEDAGAGRGGDAVGAEGVRRARLFLATSWCLLFGELPAGLTEGERGLVEAEVDRVTEGVGDSPPEWMFSDPKKSVYLPYAIFQPAAWFQGQSQLERYYRFRKWLQEMPLDFNDPVTGSMRDEFQAMVSQLDFSLQRKLAETQHMGNVEPGLLRRLTGLLGGAITEHDPEIGIRAPSMLDRVEQPESQATEQLLAQEEAGVLPLVVGLAVGNSVAASLLCPEAAAHAEEIKWGGRDGMGRLNRSAPYYGALRALNKPPDDRAPDLMSTEAWQRKQLNATLGSWTEYRYATQLATGEIAHFLGIEPQQDGFVEPVPAFFQALGWASDALAMQWEQAGHHAETRSILFALRLEEIAKDVRPNRFARHRERLLNKVMPKSEVTADPRAGRWDLRSETDRQELTNALNELLAGFRANEPDAVEKINRLAGDMPDEIGPRLARLATVCHRLEAMAERQLSGRPWNLSDLVFLEAYGQILAWLMFYEGNSFLSPRDDAPRIVRYASLGAEDGTWVYHAATARPRMFFIRYPDHEGNPVLCQGAVYSFRKVVREATPTLAEWAAESEAEPWPPWMEMLVALPEEEESAASE